MNINIYLTILLSILVQFCNGQNSDKVIIHTDNCNELIAGINNYISILALQDTFLSVDQISAYLITPNNYFYEKEPVKLEIEKEYGRFLVRPDSVGVVAFHIKLNNSIEIETISVKPLEAVCRISRYSANSESKITIAELKAQLGMIANVECCGFDAKCRMVEFEVIRIPTTKIPSRTLNTGGRFEEATLQLIHQAESGDLYLFRNIYYECPNSEKQRSEDMILEIE